MLSKKSENPNDWLQRIKIYLEYQVSLGFGEIFVPRMPLRTTQRSSLETIKAELGECVRCPLHQTRRNIVFGEGNPRARLMFVGEGPGADEDRQGRPFVGRAGQLLTKMIQAMKLNRTDVYIANIVKCRPPENREPESMEINTCFPFLQAQIAAIRPKVIVVLGKVAACSLLETKDSITSLRGKFHDKNGVLVMPTYHPSFLLRQEPDRRFKVEAWADLKKVMALLDLPVSGRGDNP